MPWSPAQDGAGATLGAAVPPLLGLRCRSVGYGAGAGPGQVKSRCRLAMQTGLALLRDGQVRYRIAGRSQAIVTATSVRQPMASMVHDAALQLQCGEELANGRQRSLPLSGMATWPIIRPGRDDVRAAPAAGRVMPEPRRPPAAPRLILPLPVSSDSICSPSRPPPPPATLNLTRARRCGTGTGRTNDGHRPQCGTHPRRTAKPLDRPASGRSDSTEPGGLPQGKLKVGFRAAWQARIQDHRLTCRSLDNALCPA